MEYERKWREARKAEKQAYDKARRAARTPEQVEADRERLQRYNGPAAVERVRKWRAANPERTRSQRVVAEGKRRARGEKASFNIEQVVSLYGTNCHLCHEPIDMLAPRRSGAVGWERSFWVDHVVSLASGGSHTLENVRPSHGLCNLRKGAK